MNKKYAFIYAIAMFLALALGVIIGFYAPNVAASLSPWGHLYIAFLKMCITPIIITSLISSIGKFFQQPDIRKHVKRFLIILGSFFVCMAAFGILFAAEWTF